MVKKASKKEEAGVVKENEMNTSNVGSKNFV